MKELAVYFKKRMKEQESIPKIWADRNFTEDIEYNIDHEIDNRKQQITKTLEKNIKMEIESESQKKVNLNQNKLLEIELKLLRTYNFQKKIRRDVVMNFVNDFDKHNTVYYSDVLFHKTLLDRRFYKRQVPSQQNKKENRLSDKFEQQLKVGIDLRKRDKHLEFINNLMQHQKEFMEFHKMKKVK